MIAVFCYYQVVILQFSVSNYRCFRTLQTLNLAASNQDKSLPECCFTADAPGLAGKRWVKGLALYGANASGKTTVLQALKTLARMVRNSARTVDPQDPIADIDPFDLGKSKSGEPTAFSVDFVTENVRYEYRVAATRQRIWHESLRAFPKKLEQLWFSRDWNSETETYDWKPDRPSGFHRDSQLESYTLSNVLFLSKAVASNRSELGPVFRWFKEKLKFQDLSIRRQLNPFRTTLRMIQQASQEREQIIAMLRHADLGVADAQVIDDRPPQEELERIFVDVPNEARERFIKERWLKPQLLHRGPAGVKTSLPWESESAGTHRFFELAGPWLDFLARGNTVCIDELETSMHPLMVRELLRLFFSDRTNLLGAQILFTTHSPLLLDPTLLRRDQVWFTDKDEEGESHLYPLTDYGPRKGESLVRGYLAGRYGAVPFVPSGLLGNSPQLFSIEEKDENGG